MTSNRYDPALSYSELDAEQGSQHGQYPQTYAPRYSTDFYGRQQGADPTYLWDDYRQKYAQRDPNLSWQNHSQWDNGARFDPPAQVIPPTSAITDVDGRRAGAYQPSGRGHINTGRSDFDTSALGSFAFASGPDATAPSRQLPGPNISYPPVVNSAAPQTTAQIYHQDGSSGQMESASFESNGHGRSWSKSSAAVPLSSTTSPQIRSIPAQGAHNVATQIQQSTAGKPSVPQSAITSRTPAIGNAAPNSNTSTFPGNNYLSSYRAGKHWDIQSAQAQQPPDSYRSSVKGAISGAQEIPARSSPQVMSQSRASSRNSLRTEVSVQNMRQQVYDQPKKQQSRSSIEKTSSLRGNTTTPHPPAEPGQGSHENALMRNTQQPQAVSLQQGSPGPGSHPEWQSHFRGSPTSSDPRNAQSLGPTRHSAASTTVNSPDQYEPFYRYQLAERFATAERNLQEPLQNQAHSPFGFSTHHLSASLPTIQSTAPKPSTKPKMGKDSTQHYQPPRKELPKHKDNRRKEQSLATGETKSTNNDYPSSSHPQSSPGEAIVVHSTADRVDPGTTDEDMEAHIRFMVEKMREYQAKDPAKFSHVWEQMKRGNVQSDTPNRNVPSLHSQPSSSPQVHSKGQTKDGSILDTPPSIPASTVAQMPQNLEEAAASNPRVHSETVLSEPLPTSNRPMQTAPRISGSGEVSQAGKQAEGTKSNLTDNRPGSAALSTAGPQAAESTAPQPPPTSKLAANISGMVWPQSKKVVLAIAAANGLMALPENSGKQITPQEISRMLNRNPSYLELCEQLEGRGFYLARSSFARMLLAAIQDNVSPSPQIPTAQSITQTAPPAHQGTQASPVPVPAMPQQQESKLPSNPKKSTNIEEGVLDRSSPAVNKRRRGRPRVYASPPPAEQPRQQMTNGNMTSLPPTTIPTDNATPSSVSDRSKTLTRDPAISGSRQPLVSLLVQHNEPEIQTSSDQRIPEESRLMTNTHGTSLQDTSFCGSQQAGPGVSVYDGSNNSVEPVSNKGYEGIVTSAPQDLSTAASLANRQISNAQFVLSTKVRGSRSHDVQALMDKERQPPKTSHPSAEQRKTPMQSKESRDGAFSKQTLEPSSSIASSGMHPPPAEFETPLNGTRGKPETDSSLKWIPHPASRRGQTVLVGVGDAPRPGSRAGPVNGVPKRAETPHRPAPTFDKSPNASTHALSKEAFARKRTFNDFVDLSQDLSEDEDSASLPPQIILKLDDAHVPNAVIDSTVRTGERSQLSLPAAQKKPGDLSALMKGSEVQNPLRNAAVVNPFNKKRALRRSAYNPKTIARDVLLASGRHPSMRPLNGHFELVRKNFTQVGALSDLSTLRWDVVDPGVPVVKAEAPTSLAQTGHNPGAPAATSLSKMERGNKKVATSNPQLIVIDDTTDAEDEKHQAASTQPHDSNASHRTSGGNVSAHSGNKASSHANGTKTEPARSSRARPDCPPSERPLRKSRLAISQKPTPTSSPHLKSPAPSGEFSILVPSHSPKRSINISEPQNTKPSNKKRKRQQPKTPAAMTDQPHFKQFKCQWMDCIASLHNIDTLRAHIKKTHCERAMHGGIPCQWAGCGRYVESKDTGRFRGRMELQNFDFSTRAEWEEHIEDVHLHELSWQYGDGPASGRRDAGGSIDYLSDATGRQLTPQASSSGPREGVAAGLRPNRAFHKLHGNTTARDRMLEVERTLERKKRETGPGVDRGGARLFNQERDVWPADDEDFARECDVDESM